MSQHGKKFQFWFRCCDCGGYPTTRGILNRFITPQLQKKLDCFLDSDATAAGAILVFAKGCPKCRKHLKSRAKLIEVCRESTGPVN